MPQSPENPESLQNEIQQVLAANLAFYTAHEERNIEAMDEIWDHGAGTACIHPGWPILRGWEAVRDSWARIFAGPGRNQFILTNVTASIRGTMAWVTLDENLMDRANTGTIAATNLFVRSANGWKLVLHHGSPVAPRIKQAGS